MFDRARDAVRNYVVDLARRVGGYDGLLKERNSLSETANRQFGLIEGFRKKALDNYARRVSAERELRDNAERHATELERQLEIQTSAVGHVKEAERANRRRAAALLDFSSDIFRRTIDEGYNPLTGESHGRYAFVDRHGNVVALSKKARKVFGYGEEKPFNYTEVIPLKDVLSMGSEPRDDFVVSSLPVKIKDVSRDVVIRDVAVSPVIARDVIVGYVVDFQKLGRLERARERIANIRDAASKRKLAEGIDSVRKALEE